MESGAKIDRFGSQIVAETSSSLQTTSQVGGSFALDGRKLGEEIGIDDVGT